MNSIKDTLQAIGEAIIQHMLFTLENKGRYPLDRNKSKLLKSFKAEVQQGRNSKGRFEGFTPNAQLTIYAEKYAEWLDRGRKPFTKRVPISAILEFIKKRNLRLRDRKTGRFQRKRWRGRNRDTGRFESINVLAFMIQNSIYKKGIQGRNFIQPGFDEGQRLVELYLDTELLDDITYELDRTLKG